MAASQEDLVELLVEGARYGDEEDVQQALELKVDVNAKDEYGKTGGWGHLSPHMHAAGGAGRRGREVEAASAVQDAAISWPALLCCMLQLYTWLQRTATPTWWCCCWMPGR